MDRQKIFNRVNRHLLKQNKQAKNQAGGCVYRAPRGLTCAIGCLIPNRLYSRDMENLSADDLIINFPKLGEHLGATRKDGAFLVRLQEIHDNLDPEDWQSALRNFAKHHRLTA